MNSILKLLITFLTIQSTMCMLDLTENTTEPSIEKKEVLPDFEKAILVYTAKLHEPSTSASDYLLQEYEALLESYKLLDVKAELLLAFDEWKESFQPTNTSDARLFIENLPVKPPSTTSV